ncbi:MFS transporter [Actinoallomurus sp. CA-150999]|uniref:MFS transporter n=1 Tax=Actinoallomurus sp. CA-150999 TaxID=3239887 RepID=UPI003D920D83
MTGVQATGGTGLRGPGRPERRWFALGVIAAAQLMTALDATIVNIALPSAQRALGFSDAQRQWVVTAYTVCFAGLLLFGGRVADTIGRRRAFQIGLAGFGLASLAAGLAPTLLVLAVGRALQGAFAALIAPTVLSLLAVTFTEQRERTRAFAIYGAVASSGAATGLLLGGVITDYLDWRWCLFVNVAIAGAVLAAGRVVLPAPPRSGSAGLDASSAVLVTGGLAAVVFGCGQAAVHGWTQPLVLGAVIGGVAMVGVFGLRQSRITDPLLPLRILADRGRAGAYLGTATAVVGAFGMFLTLTYHLQVVLHYSPVRAGLGVLPMTLANALSGYQLGNRLMPHLPSRILIAGGLLVAAAGLGLMTRLTPHSGYLAIILPAEVLIGVGMGALFPPAFQLAIRGVTQRDAGVASAVINAATQVGGSIGTAILNTLAVGATTTYLATHTPTATRYETALVHGYATATTWATGLLAVMAVLVYLLIPAPRPAQRGRTNPH